MGALRNRKGLLVIPLGLVFALGQSPWSLWPAALIALALALPMIEGRPLRAWLFAAAHFGFALHWLMAPFYVDPATAWMAPFGLALMAGGLALFWMVPVWIAARLYPGARLAMPLMIAAFEIARGYIFTGFPWAQPAHIWIDSPALALAPYMGPEGLGVMTLVIAYLAGRSVRGLAIALFCVAGILTLDLAKAPPKQAELDAPLLRIVQPNAPQHLKWRPDMVPYFYNRALDLSSAATAPDLLIWPETSLPELLGTSQDARRAIANRSNAQTSLIGAQRFDDDLMPRNVAVLLGETGEILDTYDKHHLVPFGEYLPFKSALERLGVSALATRAVGGFAAGEGPRLMDVPGVGPILPLICYEAIFPQYPRAAARPRVLVHLTNDAWFGGYAGPMQHLALAQLRAAEQGLPLVRAANTGVSALIAADGTLLAALPLGQKGALDVALPPVKNPTLYARFGPLPVIFGLLSTLVFIFVRRRRFND